MEGAPDILDPHTTSVIRNVAGMGRWIFLSVRTG